jgi:hypothetical protein
VDFTNETIHQEIEHLDTTSAAYTAALNQDFEERWNHKFDDYSVASAAAGFGGGNRDWEELQARLDDVCRFYLKTEERVRVEMREDVATRPNLLRALDGHVGWCARHIASPSDREYLRTALAAVALHDNQLDYRNTYVGLGKLYTAAVKAEIQPSLDFYKVGLLCNKQSRTKWESDSTYNFLTQFEASAFFKTDVAPKLAR